MISQLLAIARNAFVESVRQPVLLLLILVSGVLQVFNTWNAAFSLGYEESGQVGGDDKLLLDIGLATIFVIGTLLAGFIATAVMSREIENKTVLTVVSKPVGRPVLVLGKFLGVAGAIIAAVIVMLGYLQLALRHGVMATASDELDLPVIVLGVGSVAVSMLLAGWCNYFYGWNFPQTCFGLMVPLTLLAVLGVLLISPEWKFQRITYDLKDQVLIASLSLGMAILVLTAIATAASTRFSQVPTILTCLGVFIASLLSNHVIGRFVFQNSIVGLIREARPAEEPRPTFAQPGDEFVIRLDQPPARPLAPRDPFYYSPNPSGFPMIPEGEHAPYLGPLDDLNQMIGPGARPAIIVTEVAGLQVRVRNIGQHAVPVSRPPEKGDYVFTTSTRVSTPGLVLWGAIPNMQFFWLLDAVSQNRPVPPRYLATSGAYAACQVVAFLSLAVLLFQRRDVG